MFRAPIRKMLTNIVKKTWVTIGKKTVLRESVTHADAGLSVTQQRVVTIKLFVMVAGFQQRAGLPQLPGTHLTAATAIQDQANPHRTGWGVCGASTGVGAVLGHCLQQTHKPQIKIT